MSAKMQCIMNNCQAIFYDVEGNQILSVTYESLKLRDKRTIKMERILDILYEYSRKQEEVKT
jgi:hypothetical protein